MDITLKKPDPNQFQWVAELEAAIKATGPTGLDTAALQAACVAVRTASNELQQAMQASHEASEKLIKSVPGAAAKPGGLPRPPQPAGPVPIPYPNFQMGKADVTKKVQITERALQKLSMAQRKMEQTIDQQTAASKAGDAAGAAAQRGIVSSKLKGKAQFMTWSHDVKVESQNVVRMSNLVMKRGM